MNENTDRGIQRNSRGFGPPPPNLRGLLDFTCNYSTVARSSNYIPRNTPTNTTATISISTTAKREQTPSLRTTAEQQKHTNQHYHRAVKATTSTRAATFKQRYIPALPLRTSNENTPGLLRTGTCHEPTLSYKTDTALLRPS